MASTPASRGRPRGDPNAARARLMRKREIDRLAQRANRERNKQRIQMLEEEVSRLKSQDQNAVYSGLIETIRQQQNRLDELQGALTKVFSITSAACQSTSQLREEEKSTNGSDTARRDGQHGYRSSSTTSSSFRESMLDFPEEQQQPQPAPLQPQQHLLFPTETNGLQRICPLLTPQLMQTMADKFSQAACDPYLGLGFLPLAADEEKWDVSNDAFHSALVSAPSFVCPDAVDPHVPLQAIFCGWHVVDSRERENPIWKMLRLIDERVFGLWTSKAQKAALMFVTHTLIKYHMNPTPENLKALPTWLRPRPSQVNVTHPLVIDLLLWPGLRDRLVFEHSNYTKTGEFSSFYCNHLCFDWPFPDTDIYVFDSRENCFRLSSKFMEYALDLSRWTMDRAFLARYPEMKHDIPAYEDLMGLPDGN